LPAQYIHRDFPAFRLFQKKPARLLKFLKEVYGVTGIFEIRSTALPDFSKKLHERIALLEKTRRLYFLHAGPSQFHPPRPGVHIPSCRTPHHTSS